MYSIGNQAGDVDSIVSALAAAFYITKVKGIECKAVAPFPRSEFRLRGDAKLLFELAGWTLDANGTPSELIFIDEVTEINEVVLTDANQVQSHLTRFAPKVVAIFDHHKDEGDHLECNPRLVYEAAGSACSVVIRAISSDAKTRDLIIPHGLLVLVFGVILLDTRNFSGGRHNEEDEVAFKSICERLPRSLVDDKDNIYRRLMDARNDVSHLSLAELLRLDYKEVDEHGERVGFSTVFETAKKLFKQTPATESSMVEMMEEKNLSALIAITSVEKDSERRGLIVCTKERKLMDGLVSGFRLPPKEVFSPTFLALPLSISQKIVDRGFGLEPVSTTSTMTNMLKASRPGFELSTWTVHGTITRKTLLPAVMELIVRIKKL